MTELVRGPKGVRAGVPGHSATAFKPHSCSPANVTCPLHAYAQAGVMGSELEEGQFPGEN